MQLSSTGLALDPLSRTSGRRWLSSWHRTWHRTAGGGNDPGGASQCGKSFGKSRKMPTSHFVMHHVYLFAVNVDGLDGSIMCEYMWVPSSIELFLVLNHEVLWRSINLQTLLTPILVHESSPFFVEYAKLPLFFWSGRASTCHSHCEHTGIRQKVLQQKCLHWERLPVHVQIYMSMRWSSW